jgi:hypothetical protein
LIVHDNIKVNRSILEYHMVLIPIVLSEFFALVLEVDLQSIADCELLEAEAEFFETADFRCDKINIAMLVSY